MDKTEILKALKELKEKSPKRNFKQSVDFILILKNLDIKKTENQLEFFVPLNFTTDKKIKVCALVGAELKEEAAQTCDKTIAEDEFANYNKKQIKQIAREYDVFIAQANIMAKVAATFGRYLGPKGKMPNPKAGCVVPPKTALKPVYEKLQRNVKVSLKKSLVVQCTLGNEDSNQDQVAENIMTVFDNVLHHLPNEKNNIRSAMVKLTMSKPIKLTI